MASGWAALAVLAVLGVPTVLSSGYGSNTPCFDAKRQQQGLSPEPGQPQHECDRSGAFAPQQCRGSQCFCVDRNGRQLEEYAAVGRHQAHQISCACARQRSERAGRLGGEAVTCDAQGNFSPRQCVGSSCYCVNVRTGSRLARSRDVHVSQAASLDCNTATGGEPYRATDDRQQAALGGDTPCWDELQRHEASSSGLLGAEPPACDRMGRFHPKQCRGSECYCVTPAGRRLQAYRAAPRARQIFCGCARRLHEITEGGLVGVTLNCDQHGDYELKQCTGSVCHCADPVTGEKRHGSRQVAIHQLDTLSCDRSQQTDRPLLGGQTPCWDALKRHMVRQTPLLGAHKPQCDRAGKYHPKQCKGSECTCVDPYGVSLGSYRQPRGRSVDMGCLCARREWELHRDGLLGLSVNCDERGNFAAHQCVGSVCHCVLPVTGEQIPASETHIGQLAGLDCAAHRRRLLGGERPCDDRRRQMRGRLGGRPQPPGYQEPECDRDGKFAALQCTGSLCYCVSPNGERLEGYDQPIQNRQQMSCRCARRAWELSQDGLGRHVTCDRFGGFHTSQCEGSTCYCVDPATGAPSGGATVHVGELASLACGGGPAGQPLLGGQQPCWDARRRAERRLREAQHPIAGLEMPECDRSGRHQPKQCSGSQCYCVDPAGRRLEAYSVDRWRADAMTCVCARRRHEVSSLSLIGISASCDELGNFERRQCLGSQCYCVNPQTGAPVDASTVHISQSDSLNCLERTGLVVSAGGSGSGLLGSSGGSGSGHSGRPGQSGGSGSGQSGRPGQSGGSAARCFWVATRPAGTSARA
ncbi:thyroglobulin-like [Pollicipes pollicipes]|uniref:thyroglobulin-like n=1 Tax=Pollicipes pollicipes TaxID=41117 RepID=UPI00188566CF|nr:thyroglobulin-like [Pollicipes pollicipes]